MSKLHVIGISGKIQTGKNEISTQCFIPQGYYPFSFAYHFKVWAIAQGMCTYDEAFITKPPHVRDILQRVGTEEGRMVYGYDVWVKATEAWINILHNEMKIDKIVIPDVRFINEAQMVHRLGGKVFRVYAPERDARSTATEEQRIHASETALDAWVIEGKFDGYINNDRDGTVHLIEQVAALMQWDAI